MPSSFLRSKPLHLTLSALALALLATACASPKTAAKPDARAAVTLAATGETQPTQGKAIAGQLRFEQVGDIVKVTGTIDNLKPNATVGFHIHEKGDCGSRDASSAGPHFNPGKTPHGAFGGADPHHAGDLPPLQANAQGQAVVDFSTQAFTLKAGDANSIRDRALIVHRDADDPKAQPAGNSGARLACGVIRAE